MSDVLRNDLIKLYRSFMDTKDIAKRKYILNVFNTFSYLYPNNREIKRMFQELLLEMRKLKRESIIQDRIIMREKKEFIKDNKEIFSLLPSRMFILYNNGEENKMSLEYLLSVVERFLESISKDLFNFYKEREKEGKIIIGDKRKSDGFTGFLSMDDNNSFIYVSRLKTISDAKILIHEIGHAYYEYINDMNYDIDQSLDMLIKSEAPAMWLELLFSLYLGNYILQEVKKDKIRSYSDALIFVGMGIVERLRIDSIDKEIENIFERIFHIDYRELISETFNKKLIR